MLVVADSSPFIVLLKIGHVEALTGLFGEVIIPPAVAQELADARRPQIVRDFISALPPWLRISKPSVVEAIPLLHIGECEAISLAKELKADLLLIDDSDGYSAAVARHIPATRTTALLRDAADRGLLNLREAFDRLRRTNFRVSEAILQGLLVEHEDLRRKNPQSGVPDEPRSS